MITMKRPEYLLSILIYIRKIFFNRGFRLEDNKGDFIHFSLFFFFYLLCVVVVAYTHITHTKKKEIYV